MKIKTINIQRGDTVIRLGAFYEDGILRIQKFNYIESGWYIEYSVSGWNLFEIPEGGGEHQHIGKYPSFNAAYNKAKQLT